MENWPPFISVIVPTYDRPAQLSECLRSLAAQDYGHDRFQVIIVDDGSVASMNELVNAFRPQLDVTLLKQPHSGPAAARNHGAAHAKGSHLAFTDDDCRPAADWLHKLAVSFSLFPESVLGGQTVNALIHNRYSTASQLVVDYLHMCWNSRVTAGAFFASNNLALPTKCFKAIGGFDSTWDRAAGEDRDLCDRLIARGYRLVSVPGALVHHAHFLTFRAFCRQHFNYGWGAYILHRLRAQRRRGHIQFQPLTFYLRLIGYPMKQGTLGSGASMAMLLALAQAANAVGYMAAALNCLPETIENANIPNARKIKLVVAVSLKRMLKFVRKA